MKPPMPPKEAARLVRKKCILVQPTIQDMAEGASVAAHLNLDTDSDQVRNKKTAQRLTHLRLPISLLAKILVEIVVKFIGTNTRRWMRLAISVTSSIILDSCVGQRLFVSSIVENIV